MQMQMFLLNRTYIAQDRSTGLTVYADSPQKAETKLQSLVEDYWEKKKVVVPITTGENDKVKN